MFSALKIICACRIQQEQSYHDKEHGLQPQEAILNGAEACEQHTDQSIKNSIAHVRCTDSLGLEQIARRELLQLVDLIFVAVCACEHIINDGCALRA